MTEVTKLNRGKSFFIKHFLKLYFFFPSVALEIIHSLFFRKVTLDILTCMTINLKLIKDLFLK